MKLQSAVEFLSTYGFMFLIVAIILVVIIYFAFPAQTVIQNQCIFFGALQCGFTIFHTNTISNNANVVFEISNSGSAPINVINANVILSSKTFVGTCSPTLVAPGSASVCNVIVSPSESPGTQVHGYFSVVANYCNSAVSEFGDNGLNCNFSPVTYTGEFFSYADFLTAKSISSTSTSSLIPTVKTMTVNTAPPTIFVPITYAGDSNVGSATLVGPSGYTDYICSAGSWPPVAINTYSWTEDVNYIDPFNPSQYDASSGHQLSSTCTVNAGSASGDGMAALGLNSAPAPSILLAEDDLAPGTGATKKISYTVSGANGQFIVIAISCADLACDSIVPPAGCSVAAESNTNPYTDQFAGSAYIAVCPYNQNAGSYKIDIKSQPYSGYSAYVATVVYDYGTN